MMLTITQNESSSRVIRESFLCFLGSINSFEDIIHQTISENYGFYSFIMVMFDLSQIFITIIIVTKLSRFFTLFQ